MSIPVGSPAPDFELSATGGARVKLSDYVGKKTVVLYFYPKDDTPGCTAESCSFRDSYQDFLDVGAEVIGVSNDDVESHEAFKKKHRLPFVLLSDPKGATRKAFGIKKTFGLLPGRETFVIDKKGIVRDAFSSQIRVNEHANRALELVKTLESSAA
jgi:thioredoxin-dependent peroxiredoxin